MESADDRLVDVRLDEREQGVVAYATINNAELRAQGDQAVAAATKPIVKLPTKLVRQCGRCGELTSVMVEPGQPPPAFKCKICDKGRD